MNDTASSDIPELLRLGDRITVLPVIHGSGQFSLTIRRWMLEHSFDCVAVPLPESFREAVEESVLDLPRPTIVIQEPSIRFEAPPEEEDWGVASWDKSDDESNNEFQERDEDAEDSDDDWDDT